jgi:hypothetical protein
VRVVGVNRRHVEVPGGNHDSYDSAPDARLGEWLSVFRQKRSSEDVDSVDEEGAADREAGNVISVVSGHSKVELYNECARGRTTFALSHSFRKGREMNGAPSCRDGDRVRHPSRRVQVCRPIRVLDSDAASGV